MRLSLTCTLASVATLVALSSSFSSVSASTPANTLNPQLASASKINTDYLSIQKRAGEDHDHDDHDHDHEHPTTTTVVAPIASPTSSPTTPDHDHDHDHDHTHEEGAAEEDHDHADHDHDHDHTHEEGKVEEDHDHADHDHDHDHSEAGHSHGPARTCEAHSHDHGEYVIWHHIVALLVLTVVAAFGCALPMMIRDNSRTRFAVQLGKYFGAGVVLSVAFIHIMPEALFSLTHPCLSKAWTDDYPGYAPLIMMVSGLTMLVIEFLASTVVLNVEAMSKKKASDAAVVDASATAASHGAHDAWDHDHDHKHGHHESPASSGLGSRQGSGHENDGCSHAHGLTLLQCGPGVSTKVSTYMLEVGIALHSVFIGIALGTLAGSEFVAMTIAICFHQFFEGVALGSRIADLSFPRRKWLPVLLVAIFALVTPLGVGIGMGMRSSYKANSVENLIIMGVTDSIACGVLLYTAFVTLLGGDILYSERFRTETRASKASYLVAVWMGALSMAVIALWA
ncbi:solute carrier family 39 (zinc transporter), member 1/2/3 [Entomortierella parvispora]|uniref:Solute carrier family 39 (Zinc transporter), member 1/2/3 n=1 Tax=Entomortierella parvispora TaxID=205924 RepID=A0A9P3LZN6_9FUNG|nr:solute carrier family 39 (zinc transporter), member 1/2/3 [Entomortierella parvispora]